MNTRRLVVLLLAAVAAGGAALLMRGLLGGGTPKAQASLAPPPIAISEVLVANSDVQPGHPLDPSQVRWQKWPSASIDPGFITRAGAPSAAIAIAGTVARAPIVAGEPITFAKIVKSDAGGFMAATLDPGMRAVSISVSLASVAGGFILPGDRVDIILTETANDSTKHARARTVLSDVRVLAIDQSSDTKAQKAVSDAKTATLELTPDQTQIIARAQASGSLSLALRALGDNAAAGVQSASTGQNPDGDGSGVSIIRYGIAHNQADGGRN